MDTTERYTVRTSDGERGIDPAAGHVLPHEHVILDLRVWWEGEGEWDALDPESSGLRPETSFGHRHRPQGSSRENLVLADWYVAALELRKARQAGCQLIVDTTTQGLNPEPERALRAAGLAGMPLVLSVGRYIEAALSESERVLDAAALTWQWIDQIENAPPDLQRGIIGEIGTSSPVSAVERVSLEAAAATQRRTGLAINVHLDHAAQEGHKVLDVLSDAGARLDKVALSHCDAHLDVDYLLSLAKRGCFIEFDLFGTDQSWAIAGIGFSSDAERLDAIDTLVSAGHGDQLLLSHDICMKNELTRHGGWGYEHIGRTILPQLRDRVGDDVASSISARNPLRLLAIDLPPTTPNPVGAIIEGSSR